MLHCVSPGRFFFFMCKGHLGSHGESGIPPHPAAIKTVPSPPTPRPTPAPTLAPVLPPPLAPVVQAKRNGRGQQRVVQPESAKEQECPAKKKLVWIKTHKTGSSTVTNILHRYSYEHDLKVALPVNDIFFGWSVVVVVAVTVVFSLGGQ